MFSVSNKNSLTLPFVRYIVINLLNLSNIQVSQNDSIRLFFLFKLSHCPFLMTKQAFFPKMTGFDERSKFQNAELIVSMNAIYYVILLYISVCWNTYAPPNYKNPGAQTATIDDTPLATLAQKRSSNL
jgi:hypothetical protein